MATQYQGGFTVHRLRTGLTTQLSLSVKGGLYVVLDKDNKISQSTDWSNSSNQPEITPSVSQGIIKNPNWYIDMSEDETDRDAYNVIRVLGNRKVSVDNQGKLKIVNNIVDTNNIHNIKLTFICDIELNGVTTNDIKRSIMIYVNKGNGNSYWGNIYADKTTLNINNPTATLTPVLWEGPTKKTYKSDYYVMWKKSKANGSSENIALTSVSAASGYSLDTETGALTVTRDCIDGLANFECYFIDKSNTNLIYEVEGIKIADEDDPYEVVTYGTDWVGEKEDIKIDAYLVNKTTGEKYTGTMDWSVDVRDCIRYRKIDTNATLWTLEVDSETGKNIPPFTMSSSYMRLPYKQTDGVWNGWAIQGDSADTDTKVADDDESKATECDIEVLFTCEI